MARGRYSGRWATACSSSSRAAVAPGSRSSSEPGTRSAKTRMPWTVSVRRSAASSRSVSSSRVKRRPARPGGAGLRGGVQQRQRLPEVAGHRPRDDRGVALGDQQGQGAVGAQHLAQRGEGAGRVADVLEHAVAQHQVGAAGGHGAPGCQQAGEIALVGDHLDALLAGAAAQRGERVGAGVDDGDAVTHAGDPHGRAAGAATDVEDVERLAVEEVAQGLPHHGGTGVGATLLGPVGTWHVPHPRASLGRVIPGSPGCGATACGRRRGRRRRPA